MWETATTAADVVAQERAESADRERTALALTLANQVAQGLDPDALVLEEYRTATREHRAAAAAGRDYELATSTAQVDVAGADWSAFKGGVR